MRRQAALLAPLLCVLAAGCARSNMDSQPKYFEYQPAGLFKNGRVLQQPVQGTVARGDPAWQQSIQEKPAVTAALLARGRERFDVFCAPCHDRTGTGNGMIVQRGMPHPPNYDEPRLREADDQHFFDTITNGHGAMYAYGDRIAPADRWAIVAYIRALQLSQHASIDDLTPEERIALGVGSGQ